jgi:hypothetical protein
MGITATSWGPRLQQESNKFWFYAIATSILLSLYEVFFVLNPSRPPQKVPSEKTITMSTDEKVEVKDGVPVPPDKGITAKADSKSTQIYRQLIIDGCDLFIPGSTVGWIPAEPLTVGIFMSISTIVAMASMWTKIQANAAAAKRK